VVNAASDLKIVVYVSFDAQLRLVLRFFKCCKRFLYLKLFVILVATFLRSFA